MTCTTCKSKIVAHAWTDGLRSFCSKTCQCRGLGNPPHEFNKKGKRKLHCSQCEFPSQAKKM